jgi:hypothetical protein
MEVAASLGPNFLTGIKPGMTTGSLLHSIFLMMSDGLSISASIPWGYRWIMQDRTARKM